MKGSNALAIWAQCLEIIKDNVSEVVFKTWFAPIKAVRLQDKSLTLELPSDFVRNYIEENYIDLMRAVLHKTIGQGASLNYDVRIVQGATITSKGEDHRPIEMVKLIQGDSLNNGNIM